MSIFHLKQTVQLTLFILNDYLIHMGLIARKPVCGVSEKASFKPVSSARETSLKIEISPAASLHIILSKKLITKVLIRLPGCAGWSATVLLANLRRGEDRFFHVEAHMELSILYSEGLPVKISVK